MGKILSNENQIDECTENIFTSKPTAFHAKPIYALSHEGRHIIGNNCKYITEGSITVRYFYKNKFNKRKMEIIYDLIFRRKCIDKNPRLPKQTK